MCRIIEEMNGRGKWERRVYGVLTDYDLSSWTEDLKNDYTKTSQQRTGTPPYMAHELLKGTSTTHLYRHDLESLFHIMLLVCARHTLGSVHHKGTKGPLQVVMRDGNLPYQRWFDEQDYVTLGGHKSSFFRTPEHVFLSPCFEVFSPWLLPIQGKFMKGFQAQANHVYQLSLQ